MVVGDKVITWNGLTGTIVFIDGNKYYVACDPHTTCDVFMPGEIRLNKVKEEKYGIYKKVLNRRNERHR